mmetsp:Transcript_1393/g.2334  ORF Transcript_1393/g.2334 Transcript_1393/m.2334 type:complete len:134 (-) Transcript_1393:178-579(-)
MKEYTATAPKSCALSASSDPPRSRQTCSTLRSTWFARCGGEATEAREVLGQQMAVEVGAASCALVVCPRSSVREEVEVPSFELVPGRKEKDTQSMSHMAHVPAQLGTCRSAGRQADSVSTCLVHLESTEHSHP